MDINKTCSKPPTRYSNYANYHVKITGSKPSAAPRHQHRPQHLPPPAPCATSRRLGDGRGEANLSRFKRLEAMPKMGKTVATHGKNLEKTLGNWQTPPICENGYKNPWKLANTYNISTKHHGKCWACQAVASLKTIGYKPPHFSGIISQATGYMEVS